MVEIKEVLRLWKAGAKKKRIAAQTMVDVKTVRRYIGAAEDCGLVPGPEPPLDDEQVAAVVAALAPDTGRPHGESWQQCEAEREGIAKLLADRVRLSKVQRLLHRRGVDVPYATRHRFAVAELGFGQRAPTIPVADGEPGEEVHVDTGWMTLLQPHARPTPQVPRVDLHAARVALPVRLSVLAGDLGDQGGQDRAGVEHEPGSRASLRSTDDRVDDDQVTVDLERALGSHRSPRPRGNVGTAG